jgi:hypothetical protein
MLCCHACSQRLTHGAEWVAKSALPTSELSDNALRAQARERRPEAAP